MDSLADRYQISHQHPNGIGFIFVADYKYSNYNIINDETSISRRDRPCG